MFLSPYQAFFSSPIFCRPTFSCSALSNRFYFFNTQPSQHGFKPYVHSLLSFVQIHSL